MSDVSLLTPGNTIEDKNYTIWVHKVPTISDTLPHPVFKWICDRGDSEKLDSVLTFNDDIIIKQLKSVIRGKLSNNN